MTPAGEVSEGNYTNCVSKVSLLNQVPGALYLVEEPVIENHGSFCSHFLRLEQEVFSIPKILLRDVCLSTSGDQRLFKK